MSPPYRIAFIIEQALGHVTHGINLRDNLHQYPSIVPLWILPHWKDSGLAARIPVYRSNWTVQAGLQARRGLARANRQGTLDALFFHTQVTAVLAQDWLRAIPGVVSLDATPLQYDRLGEAYSHASGSPWLERWKWQLNRDCFRAARKIVAWSAWASQGLVDEYEVPEEKVTVIPPGVNTHFWERAEARRETGALKILFVGGNIERKGGNLLLETFRSLQDEWNYRGADGAPRQMLELHVVTRESISDGPGITVYDHIAPNSPELRHLYHDCDIFCLPTNGDCLPLVLAEACAASLPVISTRMAAIPEIVQEGRNGFLIEPGDGAALKLALHRLASDRPLRLQMGIEGAKIARKDHEASVNARRLVDLLKAIVDDPSLSGKRQ